MTERAPAAMRYRDSGGPGLLREDERPPPRPRTGGAIGGHTLAETATPSTSANFLVRTRQPEVGVERAYEPPRPMVHGQRSKRFSLCQMAH